MSGGTYLFPSFIMQLKSVSQNKKDFNDIGMKKKYAGLMEEITPLFGYIWVEFPTQIWTKNSLLDIEDALNKNRNIFTI